MDALGLSVPETADLLGVSPDSLSELLNGQVAVSLDMATRLEKQGWSTADMWLRMQALYDAKVAQLRMFPDR